MSNLSFQKRIAASVLSCGRNKIWLDPNESLAIGNANSRHHVRRLVKDGLIIKKQVAIHSRARVRATQAARRLGRHTGTGKRLGTANARAPVKDQWVKRMRVLRRVLVKARKNKKIDRHMLIFFVQKLVFISENNKFYMNTDLGTTNFISKQKVTCTKTNEF